MKYILRISDRIIIIFSTSSLLQNAVGFQPFYIQVSVVCHFEFLDLRGALFQGRAPIWTPGALRG